MAQRYLASQPWAAEAKYSLRTDEAFVYFEEWEPLDEDEAVRFTPFAMIWLHKDNKPDEEPVTIISDSAYVKFANPASRYALVGVAVAQIGKEARVAVTGAGNSGVFRLKAAETALSQGWSAQAVANVSGNASDMMSDIHGDAAYRAHLVGVLTRRAVARAG